jgi:hypothetical protein
MFEKSNFLPEYANGGEIFGIVTGNFFERILKTIQKNPREMIYFF